MEGLGNLDLKFKASSQTLNLHPGPHRGGSGVRMSVQGSCALVGDRVSYSLNSLNCVIQGILVGMNRDATLNPKL